MEKYIINDIQNEKGVRSASLEKFGLKVLDGKAMTIDLINLDIWNKFDPKSTMIILPGNGASIVKKYIEKTDSTWLEKWPWKFYPKAKRVWAPGEDPRTYVERADPERMILGASDVVIIDDVISSGLTIQTLSQINMPWIPKAQWSAVTWIMQKTASKRGFTGGVVATKIVGENRRAPINSLSTLIDCPDIAKSYAARNFGERSSDFLEVIKNLA